MRNIFSNLFGNKALGWARLCLWALVLVTALPFMSLALSAREFEGDTTEALSPLPAIGVGKEIGISVSAVDAISSASLGLWQEKDGGFSGAIWEKADAAHVLSLLQDVPDPGNATVPRGLLERLVLTQAALPKGVDAGWEGTFFRERLDLLMKLESYAELGKMLDLVPQKSRDAVWYHERFLASVYAQDFDAACKLVPKGLALFPTAGWQERQLFCQGVQQQYSQAAITANLMVEQGYAMPNWLQAVVLDQAHRETPEGETIEASSAPLELSGLGAEPMAMLAAGHREIKAGQLLSDAYEHSEMLAKHPNLDWDTRLAAAETALMKGALTVTEFQELLTEVPFTEQELKVAFGRTVATSPRERARQWRVLGDTITPEQRVEALVMMLGQYRDQARFLQAARAYSVQVRDVTRMLSRKYTAPKLSADAFAILFGARMFGEAWLWQDTVGKTAQDSLGAASKDLWEVVFALFRPLAEGAEAQPVVRDDIQRLVERLNPEMEMAGGMALKHPRFWLRVSAMLRGLGYKVPESVTGVLAAQGRGFGAKTPEATLMNLREAVAQGRMGEAILHVLHLVKGEPQRLDDAGLEQALAALVHFKLEREALALAHEALAMEMLQ